MAERGEKWCLRGAWAAHSQKGERRVPGVGHQTGLAQEGMFWGQMGMGEAGGVCVYG